MHCLKFNQLWLLTAATCGLLLGCSHMERRITHTNWVKTKGGPVLYVAYWQGECRKFPFPGCDVGTAMVKSCSVKKSNELNCRDEESANDALKTR